jgi:hypothetical protein
VGQTFGSRRGPALHVVEQTLCQGPDTASRADGSPARHVRAVVVQHRSCAGSLRGNPIRSIGPGWSEGRRSDRHPPSRAGFSGEPAGYSVVVASMAAWPWPESMAILRGWACSVTGSVTVRTPWS